MMQEQETLCKYKNAHEVETMGQSAGCHHGSCKVHQVGYSTLYVRGPNYSGSTE